MNRNWAKRIHAGEKLSELFFEEINKGICGNKKLYYLVNEEFVGDELLSGLLGELLHDIMYFGADSSINSYGEHDIDIKICEFMKSER